MVGGGVEISEMYGTWISRVGLFRYESLSSRSRDCAIVYSKLLTGSPVSPTC